MKRALRHQEEALDVISTPAEMQKALEEAKHLTYAEKLKLGKVLNRHKDVFDGSLGMFAGGDYHVNLKDDTPRSTQKRCFPVAKCHEKKFKTELNRLVKLKVIRKLHGPEAQGNFAFPAFTVPKKNTEEVRFVSDFRELNKHVQRSPCLVPPIRDTLNKMEGFKHATTIDTSMGCWHVSLDVESQLKRVITTP